MPKEGWKGTGMQRRSPLLLTHAARCIPCGAPDIRARDVRPPGPLITTLVRDALAHERLPATRSAPLNPTAGPDRPGAGGLDHTNSNELDRFLRRTLHNRDGYHQQLELAAARGLTGGGLSLSPAVAANVSRSTRSAMSRRRSRSAHITAVHGNDAYGAKEEASAYWVATVLP